MQLNYAPTIERLHLGTMMDEKTTVMPNEEKCGSDASPPSVSSVLPLPPVNDSAYGSSEDDFDTGLKAWLQVLGAFFLWFNSW
jgi:hypothetical protein